MFEDDVFRYLLFEKEIESLSTHKDNKLKIIEANLRGANNELTSMLKRDCSTKRRAALQESNDVLAAIDGGLPFPTYSLRKYQLVTIWQFPENIHVQNGISLTDKGLYLKSLVWDPLDFAAESQGQPKHLLLTIRDALQDFYGAAPIDGTSTIEEMKEQIKT